MKKILIVTALATFLSACTNLDFSSSSTPKTPTKPQLDRSHFIGDWACEMDGGKIGTSNRVKLSEDGHASYVGTITMPKTDPLFQYEVKRTGSWDYANNTLSYTFNKSSVKRAHTDEMLRNIKTNRDLNNNENVTFNAIKSQMTKAGNTSVNLAVSEFQGSQFTIAQTVAETTRKGSCQRPIR